MLRLQVLGSAAGGGFPQWNCACENCRAVRAGEAGFTPRTQSSVAFGTEGDDRVLGNASPDLRQQLLASPDLGPGGSVRGSGIAAVVLTDAELDHTLGLLLLRETDHLVVYGTPAVRASLREGHPLLPTLGAFAEVEWRTIPVEGERREAPVPGLGLECTAFDLPGDPPAYADRSPATGDVIGLELTDPESGERLLYAPAVGTLDRELVDRIGRCRTALLDGTFWTEEEMSEVGVDRTAGEMDHLPVSGPEGSLERLAPLDEVRKIYVHVNNTNPMLREDGPERATVEEAGFEVARDGMCVRLPAREPAPSAPAAASAAGG